MDITLVSHASNAPLLHGISFALCALGVLALIFSAYSHRLLIASSGIALVLTATLTQWAIPDNTYEITGTVSSINLVFSDTPEPVQYSVTLEGAEDRSLFLEPSHIVKVDSYLNSEVTLTGCTAGTHEAYRCMRIGHSE